MEEVIKINRTIAEFMGYEVVLYQHNVLNPIYNGNKYAKTIGELAALWDGLPLVFTGRFVNRVTYPFLTDFNYLIPVIRRIEEQGYVVAIKGIKYEVYKVMDEQNPIVSLVCGDLAQKTRMTCWLIVEFIESLKNKN